ncbi:cop9 signalosome subunit 7 [Trichoderma arundinaceum]|uniref:Cop9 signalosome subunit 7 n=1 Tax=Trichoderma arundinaceum TaxID=490622 RepID=A0A395NSF4_TRIAR|nr:cop9 signalosome subunit 7 [Trichoderma arundinaceum]
MEQTKALNALEQITSLQPFLALSKSATSPRAAADLVTRATSAPNTFLFTELLQTPQIQALAASAEFTSYLTLLQIFSYGTYGTYNATPDLPTLNDTQTLKLRQLSLLSLVSDRSNLSYDALQKALGLSSAREVEDLVITAIYAGLLHATLDPARQAIQISSVAPLRDLAPGTIPDMIRALQNWAGRCQSTLGDLEEQIKSIRDAATAREKEKQTSDIKLHTLMESVSDMERIPFSRDNLTRRAINKRSMAENLGPAALAESMDLDDAFAADDPAKRASKRKL